MAVVEGAGPHCSKLRYHQCDLFALQVAGRLVPMTITLWNKIQAKMLPTPAKFHYLFNMRELSKVFQGIILATRDRCVLSLENTIMLPSMLDSSMVLGPGF